MNILKRIFGSPEDATTIIKGATSGLDHMFFSKEERAEASAKLGDFYLKYLESTQGQNLARRFIAVLVTGLWVLLIVCGALLWKIDAAYSEFIFKILADIVMVPFSIIVGFYFLTHTARAFRKGQKNG